MERMIILLGRTCCVRGTFSHNDTEGRSERALSVGLEFCALGGECAAALKVAPRPAVPCAPRECAVLELAGLFLGLVLGSPDAEGLNLLLAGDARALLGSDLAAKRVKVKGGSLGVLGSRSLFRSQILGPGGLGFGEGREGTSRGG
ncbi:hypothetical protein B0H14DRAFT_2653039 [Mycena olivaceomarginata]|nr:hypothetical protein B0H14DRAFT_2653039 [Mycena olivaceomarginata]